MQNRKDENPALLTICMNALDETWSKDVSTIKKGLTVKMCRIIHEWRCGENSKDLFNLDGHSWKTISTFFVDKNPEFSKQNNILSDNAVSGMMLCEAAVQKLKAKKIIE
jgi:hypothetical protein